MGRLGLLGELRLVQFSQGRRATRYSVGPCRREERTRLEHVPDGLGELASHLDPGDRGPALAAEPTLGALVVLDVDRVLGRMEPPLR